MTGLIIVAALLGQVRVQDEGGATKLANTINCSGAGVTCSVNAGTATVNVPGAATPEGGWSGTGTCSEGQFVRQLQKDAAPVCAKPTDTDTRGMYTFGGYSPPGYGSGVQFSRFIPVDKAGAMTLHFAATATGSGASNTELQVVHEGTGVLVCVLSVPCVRTVGSGLDTTCLIDGKRAALNAGEPYLLRWKAGCTSNPSGNATFVASEDLVP